MGFSNRLPLADQPNLTDKQLIDLGEKLTSKKCDFDPAMAVDPMFGITCLNDRKFKSSVSLKLGLNEQNLKPESEKIEHIDSHSTLSKLDTRKIN
jgi:hypothetical protein